MPALGCGGSGACEAPAEGVRGSRARGLAGGAVDTTLAAQVIQLLPMILLFVMFVLPMCLSPGPEAQYRKQQEEERARQERAAAQRRGAGHAEAPPQEVGNHPR
eukprot:7298405-Pyramimonas_sp.AAC.1